MLPIYSVKCIRSCVLPMVASILVAALRFLFIYEQKDFAGNPINSSSRATPSQRIAERQPVGPIVSKPSSAVKEVLTRQGFAA